MIGSSRNGLQTTTLTMNKMTFSINASYAPTMTKMKVVGSLQEGASQTTITRSTLGFEIVYQLNMQIVYMKIFFWIDISGLKANSIAFGVINFLNNNSSFF